MYPNVLTYELRLDKEFKTMNKYVILWYNKKNFMPWAAKTSGNLR